MAMADAKIDADGIPTSNSDGGDVAGDRSPDAIQREIEQTRAELADTIDAIADRISPKRAASRGAQAVRAQVSSVLSGGGNGQAPAGVIDASPEAAASPDPAERQRAIRSIAASGGGATYTGTRAYTVQRRLRMDRVLLAVGAAAAVAGAVVV